MLSLILPNVFNATDNTTEKYLKSALYKLTCSDRFFVNITRYHEHLRSFRLNRNDSTRSIHCSETDSTFSTLEETRIHYHNTRRFIKILENLEIFKNLNNPKVCKLILCDKSDLRKSGLYDI